MKTHPLAHLAASAVLAFASAAAAHAQAAGTEARDATMATTVGQRWQMLERQFVDLADAMPEEKWTFKPKDGAFDTVRTFGEQVKHVACANEALALEVRHQPPPPDCRTGGPNPAKTKTELMAYLRQSFAAVHEVIAQMTPANALDAAGGPYGGESTRLGLATLAVWHGSDHYGQLAVYLRLNGIVPPASR